VLAIGAGAVAPTRAPTDARQCRFDFTQSVGGMAGSMWQLSEIELYVGGSRIALTDSVSNTDGAAYDNEGSLNLIDGSTDTKDCCHNDSGDTIVVTLTLPTSITSPPTSYTFWTANDYTDRDPTSWTFSCKNGDGAYTTLDTQSGVSPPSARSSQYPIFNDYTTPPTISPTALPTAPRDAPSNAPNEALSCPAAPAAPEHPNALHFSAVGCDADPLDTTACQAAATAHGVEFYDLTGGFGSDNHPGGCFLKFKKDAQGRRQLRHVMYNGSRPVGMEWRCMCGV